MSCSCGVNQPFKAHCLVGPIDTETAMVTSLTRSTLTTLTMHVSCQSAKQRISTSSMTDCVSTICVRFCLLVATTLVLLVLLVLLAAAVVSAGYKRMSSLYRMVQALHLMQPSNLATRLKLRTGKCPRLRVTSASKQTTVPYMKLKAVPEDTAGIALRTLLEQHCLTESLAVQHIVDSKRRSRSVQC